jgi:hypothetical protein
VTVATLAALAVWTTCEFGIGAAPAQTKDDLAQPLPPDLVAAWRTSGAIVGLMRVEKDSIMPQFLSEKVLKVTGQKAEAGDVPAFGFLSWNMMLPASLRPDDLAKLPAPAAPFGLSLSGAGVPDEGLKGLARFKGLHTLDLTLDPVTDAGLRELAALAALRSLNLAGTKVTDAGLKHLAGLKSLERLSLGGTAVTNEGLKALAALNQLQALDLADTEVTDAGVKALAGLKGLRMLSLRVLKVSAAAVKELVALKSLRTLDLGGTTVTEAGVKDLRKAMPDCTIRGPK